MLERQTGIGESAKTIYLMTHQRGQREALKHARERPPCGSGKALKSRENQAGLSCLLRTACSVVQNNLHGNANEGKSALEIEPEH